MIVGAGIAGLALAAYLRERGIRPVVIEKTPEWKTIGYVLGLYPDGMRILEGIGAAGQLKQKGKRVPAIVVRDEAGKKLFRFSLLNLEKRFGPVVEAERDTIHRILREINKHTDIRLNTTLKSLRQKNDGVEVTFSDGRKEQYDVVVGADGVNSQVRQLIFPRSGGAYVGMTYFFVWADANVFENPPQVMESYFGRGKAVAVFPTQDRTRVAVFFIVPAKEHTVTTPYEAVKFLKSHFSDMGGDVARVLKSLPEKSEAVFNHDDDEIRLKQWFRGRVVLVGDAAHALSPTLGMGASMALEDAYVLADELSLSGGRIERALQQYVKRREPRIRELALLSRLLHLTIMAGKRFYTLRNLFLKYVFSKFYYRYIQRFLDKPI